MYSLWNLGEVLFLVGWGLASLVLGSAVARYVRRRSLMSVDAERRAAVTALALGTLGFTLMAAALLIRVI